MQLGEARLDGGAARASSANQSSIAAARCAGRPRPEAARHHGLAAQDVGQSHPGQVGHTLHQAVPPLPMR